MAFKKPTDILRACISAILWKRNVMDVHWKQVQLKPQTHYLSIEINFQNNHSLSLSYCIVKNSEIDEWVF